MTATRAARHSRLLLLSGCQLVVSVGRAVTLDVTPAVYLSIMCCAAQPTPTSVRLSVCGELTRVQQICHPFSDSFTLFILLSLKIICDDNNACC
jgi:hypothetical protein